ncbi:MAG TPA: UvrD-helicase domain-containing protein [Nitrospirota bacterium]
MNNQDTTGGAADTARSIHLSASAGSGKTRALKDRCLALLNALDLRGLGLDQAVAITFTDKAAAEIRERVLRGLPESLLRKVIRGQQDLRISTIHSFCMNLLKRYPLEAGLPPDFGVLDSRDQDAKVSMAIEDALEASDRDPGIMGPLSDYTINELISIIEFLLSIRSRLKRMEIDAGGQVNLIRSIRDGMAIDASEAELNALITGTEWRTTLARMEQVLRKQNDNYAVCMGPGHLLLAKEQDIDAVFRAASAIAPIYFTQTGGPRKSARIPAKSFRGGNRREYEELFFRIQELLYQFRNAYQRVRAGREAVSVLRLALLTEERYQKSKFREGLLDFDDLEIYAYRLLRNSESPDILYWLDRKILHFLVDEFQDTSDIQWAILDRLTEEIFSGQGAEKGMPPTLFVVGDEKQSIYRFREANYRLIDKVRDRMTQNLLPDNRDIRTLSMNFRSTPAIIETVNRVFTGLWGERYQRSDAARKNHLGTVRLIEIIPSSEKHAPGPDEAQVLARSIRSLVAAGTLVYERSPDPPAGTSDGDPWVTRPADYGDCAILIQSRTRLKEYEAALQSEGIPYRVVGGIGFYEEDEIQAVMNVLFFLWNRDDSFALAAALKSPLFGLTDQDLFDLMRDNGPLPDALQSRQPSSAEMLRGWQRIAGLTPLAELIRVIINETGAYIRFGRRNPQAIFNIDKLLDTAREFDRRGYTTLQDFVEWVKNIQRNEQREAAADMNLPGFQRAVSIMTVHKAKGLEFPIVFLPAMAQFPRSLSIGPEALIEEADGVRRMAIKRPDNPVYEDLWKGDNGEQGELTREHQRLLYVAMTRARDHLIMTGAHGNGKTAVRQNTWLEYLHRDIPMQHGPDETGGRVVQYSYPSWEAQDITDGLKSEPRSTTAKGKELTLDVKRVLENISPLPRSEAAEWKRATDFIEHEKEAMSPDFTIPSAMGAISPLIRGSVLHRCLENFARNGSPDIIGTMREFPEVFERDSAARDAFQKDIETVLGTVAGSPDLAWIFERGPGSYAELPFLYKKGHSLVSGIIDRVIVKDKKGYVVDYKAIAIDNNEALKTWSDHYRPQIRIYCEAVKQIFRLESVEGYLLFLDSSRLEPVVRL